jgi:RNA polymerase sigma factor (TIGR02999 family)
LHGGVTRRLPAMSDRTHDLTRLLRAEGDRKGEIIPLIYDELRRIASSRLANERVDHTLQSTALVNEAYLKLLGDEQLDWSDRRRFYGAASEAMRRILVDHARTVGRQKRGGDRVRVTLGSAESPADVTADQVLALSDALDHLEREDPRAAEVTRLRYFGGLSVEQTAETMELSERTVHREWAFARARLLQLLEPE